MSTTTTHAPTLRSLYRRLLRELPTRQPALAARTRASHPILSNASRLQRQLRATLATPPSSSQTSQASESSSSPEATAIHNHRLHATDQFIQYAKAQRTYLTLLERYNPGMGMDEEERVRLTARRVGMDLPEEFGKK
ncbi:hypothetical protein K490DRAFT_63439 [Saccharata proteae CBS 121410]|uniref:Ras guanyl-nucleotide exchange factor RasGEF n=1 Tax=Saccharata proteae CBS 121410 TaxID=1314787 RepID=A0A6A5YCR6_9PEZI|nr:hypothetical protein K490DRAFT_63439 [Saccharata proteae CBS 121410]